MPQTWTHILLPTFPIICLWSEAKQSGSPLVVVLGGVQQKDRPWFESWFIHSFVW